MSTATNTGPEMLAATTDGDELLDLEAAAEQLCVSKTTLYRMLDRGEVKGIKVGRQWRFRARDIEAYLARGPVAAALAAMPVEVLDVEIAAIAGILRHTDDDIPAVVDDSLDQWESRVVQLLLGIVKLARVQRASDIHLEVIKEGNDLQGLIRFRIDGTLHEVHRLPIRVYEALVLRMRVMGSGDPGNGGYLDASLHLPLGDTIEDVRISILSTFLGEAVTIRLHSASDIKHATLEQLGFHPDDLQRLRVLIQRPSGLILTAGPSGSGKSTLLYKMLQEITHPSRKIITIEDPVEYQLLGVTQVEVNAKTRNFASALRAFFLHDADVVMVGQLRDLETMDLAIHLAENGHLVFSPVHIMNPIDTLQRIVDVFPVAQQMPIRVMLANNVLGVVELRLVRVLCPACKQQQPVPDAMREQISRLGKRYAIQLPEALTCYHAMGCPECGDTGFRGRTGIYEVMEMTPEFREAFLRNAPRDELLRLVSGVHTLASEGIRKALDGITTFEEVLSIVQLYEQSPA